MVSIETFEFVLPMTEHFLNCLFTFSVKPSVWVRLRERENELTAAGTYASHRSIIAPEMNPLYCQKFHILHHDTNRNEVRFLC